MVRTEQHVNQQPQQRNENVEVNNANKSTSTGDNVKEMEGNVDASGNRIPSFWIACPYCPFMYEYSVDHTYCTFKLANTSNNFDTLKYNEYNPWGTNT